jgi:hypothetical protein
MADSTNFLPNREAELVTWANNFQSKIQAAPTRYNLTPAQATAFTTLHTAWNLAYQTAKDPDTNSRSNTAAKDTAKDAMVNGPGGIRELARVVQSLLSMPAEYLRELGLTVRDNSPTPIPVPIVSPEMDFVPTATRLIRVRLHNEKTLNRRKPAGVKGAAVFYHIGATPPAEWKDWTFCENTTRQTIEVDLGAEVASGTTVWFTACWFNPRMENGPAATPMSTVVQWGGLSMAA